MQEFKLPDLGEGMQEAEIRRWLVKPGDVVKMDQPMVEVETDKAVVEIPSPVAGRIADILVQEGQVAKLGAALVTFEAPAGSVSTSRSPSNGAKGAVSVATASRAIAPTASTASPSTTAQRRVLAAPAVRKRAFELGIDLEKVPSSQSTGRVTMDDLLAYAERAKAAPAALPTSPATPVVSTNGIAAAPAVQPIE